MAKHNQTFDGSPLPDATEGWLEITPAKPEEFSMLAIKTVRMTDGSVRRFYKLLVKPSVLKKKRAKFRRKMRELDQSIAVAAKQEARVLLWKDDEQGITTSHRAATTCCLTTE